MLPVWVVIRGAVRVTSPPLVVAWPLATGAALADALRIAVCPSEILWVASIVIVGVAAAGATALGLAALAGLITFAEFAMLPAFPIFPALPAFVALIPEAFEILALLAAVPTGGPITMTADGTLFEEVTKGTLLWVPVACT